MAKKTIILVGGMLEFHALKTRCPGTLVRVMRGANALDPTKGLVRRVVETVRPQLASIDKLVVVLDREASTDSCCVLQNRVAIAISRALVNTSCEVICPDTMIENWILADVNAIKKKKYISNDAKQKSYDGKHGKNELKKIVCGVSYRETRHGVELLGLIRDRVASKNSPSFKAFVSALG